MHNHMEYSLAQIVIFWKVFLAFWVLNLLDEGRYCGQIELYGHLQLTIFNPSSTEHVSLTEQFT